MKDILMDLMEDYQRKTGNSPRYILMTRDFHMRLVREDRNGNYTNTFIARDREKEELTFMGIPIAFYSCHSNERSPIVL